MRSPREADIPRAWLSEPLAPSPIPPILEYPHPKPLLFTTLRSKGGDRAPLLSLSQGKWLVILALQKAGWDPVPPTLCWLLVLQNPTLRDPSGDGNSTASKLPGGGEAPKAFQKPVAWVRLWS